MSDDNITVTVEWVQQAGALYNTNILPVAPSMFNKNTSLQLTLQYNTDSEYNLSVVAITLCGINATASITLNYTVRHFIKLYTSKHP